MSATKTKLKVVTRVGTFTRGTARVYSHLVVMQGYRAERLEASRLAEILRATREAAKYRRAIETGECQDVRPQAAEFDRRYHAAHLADGKYAQWIADIEVEIARLTALGEIRHDLDNWGLDAANLESVPRPRVLGWCGRLDLARKLAASEQASHWRHVWIFDVQTGEEVTR